MAKVKASHATVEAAARLGGVGGRLLLGAMAVACASLAVCTGAPNAGAVATAGQPPLAGPTGLPDGRLFEQVSPTKKHGNYFYPTIKFGLASTDGDAVVYPMSGPVGEEASSGLLTEFASKRTPGRGWQTTSTTPRPTASEVNVFDGPLTMVPSADFTRFAFTSLTSFVPDDIATPQLTSGVNVFVSYGPFAEPAWAGRPRISEPIPRVGHVGWSYYSIAGASPSLETVYFRVNGTLVPEDASRQPHADNGVEPEGFYEWHAGVLVSAGALPDGGFSPFGSLPAAVAGQPKEGPQQANSIDNQTSEDGTRAFFVSPDPKASTVTDGACAGSPSSCTSEPPELYLRKPAPSGEKTSVLVSVSQLPGKEGEAAPSGVRRMPLSPVSQATGGSYIYATPDGSHAFFASQDQLTSAAPPNSELKLYDYETASGQLTYLPGVTPPLVQVSRDGSELLFVERTSSSELKLWRSGPGGGSVSVVAEGGGTNVDQAHMSEDGSVIVFRANAATVSGGTFNSGGYEQVYRYDVTSNVLSCLSCPPEGIVPAGNARMSYNSNGEENKNGSLAAPATTMETRTMAADGSRVFFDTPAALVPQDTNGVRDVYEWENGTVYLISSGSSPQESFYLDNDRAGENVFFATSSGLVTGDTDEAYDVYDARIPRRGDNPPPEAVPCKGSVCQGPPSVPQLLGEPASEAFDGTGNVTVEPVKHATARSLTRKQKLARALKACKRHKVARKRASCDRRAHRRFAANAAGVRRGNRGNGRGK